MVWVITYDIQSSKRWKKIFDHLKKVAFHIQFSVFYNDFTNDEMAELHSDLLKYINKKKDDLRIYKIENLNGIYNGGKNILPKGVKMPNNKLLKHLK